jgi:lipoyl(octanoyl) transferase
MVQHPFPSPHPQPSSWKITPGLTPYDAAHTDMKDRIAAIRDGRVGEMVWLLEHEPVYTAGRSARSEDLINPGTAQVREVGRGGEWTWHGQGQRIAYLMLDVAARGQDVRKFINQVEEWVILTLQNLGVESQRRAGYPGVWISRSENMPPAKIAAVGVRLNRWVSWHGVAINLNPDLSVYEGIIPCGITDGRMTSLHAEGRDDLTMADLDAALSACFAAAFPIP